MVINWTENGAAKSHSTVVTPTISNLVNKNVEFTVSNSNGFPPLLLSAFNDNPEIFRVLYESGHTIIEGKLTFSNVQDVSFNNFLWADFANHNVRPSTMVDVRIEKPQDPIPNNWNPPADGEDLFSWVVRDGLSQMGLDLPGANCWLFCDDGAEETADFIHLDLNIAKPHVQRPKLTLIHVKGADGNKKVKPASIKRRVVARPYEVVTSQAIKNLRFLFGAELAEKLKLRAHIKTRSLWDRPWNAGTPPTGDHAKFIKAIDSLGNNYDLKVIIIQPHTQMTKYYPSITNHPNWKKLPVNGAISDEKVRGYSVPHNETYQAKKLRNLLFGVQQATSAYGAELLIVGDRR